MKKSSVRIIALAAALVLMLLSACATPKDPGEATGVPEVTDVPAVTNAPAVTDAPSITDAPAVTDAPAPTEVPATKAPAVTPAPKDPGTDKYFDFSEYGEDIMVPDPNGAAGLENYEEGMVIFPQASDPYVWILLEEQLPASEYRYVAFRVLASRNDKNGQVRFATTTDDRGWAMLSFKYETPGSWETIVLDLGGAAFLNEDTMDGDIVRVRIDPYDDEFDEEPLSDEYTLIVESFALFTGPEKARAYQGLYAWPEDPDKTPVPATATPDGGATPAPTHKPTSRPDGAPEFNDIGTEYYFDFTQYGNDEMTVGNGLTIDQEKEGILLTPEAWDPYGWITFDPRISASEYRYVAIKVKANVNDRQGQLRYVTTSDGRGWAMVPFNYGTPGQWEVIVLDISEANYMESTTLNGDLVRMRIDPYDDEADPQGETLSPDHTLLIESVALFNDKAKAEAYAGLYKWN